MQNQEYDRSRYEQYLLSQEWKEIQQKRFKIDNFKCCMCGSNGTQNNPLQCHHITYRNLYKENVYKDLLTLCRNCHKSVHFMMNRITSPEGRKGWKDELRISNHILEVGKERIGIEVK